MAFRCLDVSLLVPGDKQLTAPPCISPKPASPTPILRILLKIIYSNFWKTDPSNTWVSGHAQSKGVEQWRHWHRNDINCPWRPTVSNTRFIAAVMERHVHSPERRRRYWGRSGTESDHGKIWSPAFELPEAWAMLWEAGTDWLSLSPVLFVS